MSVFYVALFDWNILISFRIHYVKSVQIRSYFWSILSCIQSEYKKLRTRNYSVFGHFSLSDIYFFNKGDIKIRFRSTVSFDCNDIRMGPILRNSFNDWITDIFRCSVNLIKLWNVKIGYDIRKEFIQNFGSFSL